MTNDATTIRRADRADCDNVWALAHDFPTSFVPTRDAFERTFTGLLRAPDALLLVAEGQVGVIGYLLAHTQLTFFANKPVTWVQEVMVAPEARRTGVGSALMAGAEDWSRKIGAAYLALSSRRAGDFYLALDYEDSAVFYKKTFVQHNDQPAR